MPINKCGFIQDSSYIIALGGQYVSAYKPKQPITIIRSEWQYQAVVISNIGLFFNDDSNSSYIIALGGQYVSTYKTKQPIAIIRSEWQYQAVVTSNIGLFFNTDSNNNSYFFPAGIHDNQLHCQSADVNSKRRYESTVVNKLEGNH